MWEQIKDSGKKSAYPLSDMKKEIAVYFTRTEGISKG